jgi:hypothetical protein
MLDLSPLLAFIAAASLLTVTPGVDTAVVLRAAVVQTLDRLTGCIFLAFGLKLAATSVG